MGRMEVMESEISNKFAFAEQVKARQIAQAQELTARRGRLETRLGMFGKHTHFLQIKADGKAAQVAESEVSTSLEQLETKIKQYEQNNFHLQQFVRGREAETDLGAHKENVLLTCTDINKILIANCRAA